MFKKLIIICILLLGTVWAMAQDIPSKPSTLVNDYTNTLSAGDKQQLEAKVDAFNDSTSTQIAVVLIKSLGDYDIDEYGTALGRKWGIGQKDKNNGILILAALDDHKVTIQVGYGLEGAVPDAVTHQIIADDITPHFKQGDYYGGLDAAITDIIKSSKGEYKGNGNHKSSGGGGAGFIVFGIIVFILFLIFRSRGGGGGHIIGGRGGASPFWWFLAGDMLGGAGRGGGGWGGFSGGGDSGGGGGFGGFGGGSFGGGGSSGSW